MILAVESSCDESALALFDPGAGLVGEWVHSQIARHRPYGGVVPDLASREHLGHFPDLLEEAHARLAGVEQPVEQVAVTQGPGLAGCLALGLSLAKALALAWEVPLVGVNHLRAHAWSPFVGLHAEDPQGFEAARGALLPHLGLLVSGGNTLLFELRAPGEAPRILAATRDDAAGEALDKGGKLLGLPYPAGPLIEERARGGDPRAFDFPRAFLKGSETGFSFSGLKTSLRYTVEKMDDTALAARMADLCASYQQAVVEALAAQVARALAGGGYRSVGLSGGVAQNTALRAALGEEADRAGVPLRAAERHHCGDNAGMVAFAAWADAAGTHPADGLRLGFEPGLRLDAVRS